MAKTMSMENQIKSIYPSLTKSQRLCADYILQHMEECIDQTLAQMSKKAKVGETTILRFIYALGYSNIAQFKLKIVKDVIVNKDSDEQDDSDENYAGKINDLMLETVRVNKSASIVKAMKLIGAAKHVYFWGNGASGFSAEVGAYRFFRAGVPCSATSDVHRQEMEAVLARKNEVIVAISLSGDNIDLNQSIVRAKKSGCRIITISGHMHTVLSECGDVNLYHVPIALNVKGYYGGILGIMIQEFVIDLIFREYEKVNPGLVDSMHQITTEAVHMEHERIK